MKTDFLKRFLELYWIRPETAIFNALLAKNIPKNYLASALSADINCGDGLFSFIANGGNIDAAFNLYETAKISSNVVKSEDIYSHYDQDYAPKILSPSEQQYDFGIDISEAMLNKAASLPIYKELVRYSGEKHLSLEPQYPLNLFPEGSPLDLTKQLDLITIFSSVYMYQDVPLLLKKINGLLRDNGLFLVNVKTPHFRQFYEQFEKHYPKRFSNYIERNMRQTICSFNSEGEWERLFCEGGFVIENKIPTMHLNLVPVWTIGLRFLTPLLIKMSGKISTDDYLEIKQEFVEAFYEVLSPFYEEKIDAACSWLYVLKKTQC